jgi:hypothetical protein
LALLARQGADGSAKRPCGLPQAECRLNVSINLVLPKGIYLVKLHTRKGVFHQRVQIL